MTAFVKNTGWRVVRWFKRIAQKNKTPYRWYEVDHCRHVNLRHVNPLNSTQASHSQSREKKFVSAGSDGLLFRARSGWSDFA
jgi:hypothetical protein